MKNKSRIFPVFAAFLGIVIFTLEGCGDQNAGGPPPLPEVSFVTVESRQVLMTTELPGRISAYRVAEVRPQVNGIIQKRLFTEGSEVKEGQALFQIDAALYQATFENAKAALARSEAQLSSVSLKEKRLKNLLDERAVSRQDYDDAAAALKQVQADIQYAKASLETARIHLQYTTIEAPVSGRIGKSSVTEGALVAAGQPLALATIQQLNPMYVDVTQSTTDIQRLRRQLQEGQLDQNGKNQQKVRLLLDDGTEYPLKGTLQFRDVTVDPSTGSVVLRIVFPNPKGILLPGMFVRAVVQEGINKQALLIPQQAVSRDPKGNPQTLVVTPDGKVEQRGITVDRAIGNDWLISSGLNAGERVIMEGALKIRPGLSVKAVPFNPKADKNNPAGPGSTESGGR